MGSGPIGAEAIFWMLGGLMLAICVTAMAGALRARPRTGEAPDVAIYRDQMRELDRDSARGTLASDEAEAARVEVARRLLAADRGAAPVAKTGAHPWLGLAAVTVPVVAVTLGTYLAIGAPGYEDLPLQGRIARVEEARASRPGQAAAEAQVPDAPVTADAEIVEMAARLKEVLAGRPDDLRGWQLAVGTQSGLGDLEAAWRSQDRIVALLGDAASGEDFALLGELMVMAAGGYVSPEAETALAEAVRRDPGNGTARYYAGLMFAQQGRPDRAWEIWRALVADSAPDAPWLDPIYARIEAVSEAAGEPTPLSELPAPRGPSEAEVAASEALGPEERVAMIGGMVDGLAARLAQQGGPAEDWARLVTSYGVLGRSEDAESVYAEGRLVFAEDPAALDTLARAAERAGLAP